MQQGRVIGSGAPEEVFSQEILIREADLTRPWLVDMHYKLVKKVWLVPDAPLPKTREELYSNIPRLGRNLILADKT